MSDDPQALQRLMDDYADGRLEPAEMPTLIEHLRTSESARDHREHQGFRAPRQ